MPRVRKTPTVDGNHVLYHYLQKDLRESDWWLFQMLTARLVVDLGVWLHPRIYSLMPVLLPHVVRDPKCRRRAGGEEQWGSPDASGHFRDDNSLIKGLIGSLVVNPRQKGLFGNSRLGKGFVASHVWTVTGIGRSNEVRTSRLPWLNSFVPNLVWLPAQVSKLSDREGSFVQMFLQALATRLYKGMDVEPEHELVADRCWSLLSEPEGIPKEAIPPMSDLNFFDPSPRFLEGRLKVIKRVVELADLTIDGRTPNSKLVSARFDSGLHLIEMTALLSFRKELAAYAAATESVLARNL